MLRANQIAFRYPQEGHGLSPVSLNVEPGKITLVTGPSGCGKSTLARCLMGLIPHLYHGEISGEVWLNGYRTDEVPMWQLAEKAGMVFQNPAAQMLAPTVEDEIIFGLENLGLAHDEITVRLETALTDFNLAHMRHRNPQTLSGGEQQRLALAAILARQPDALILDEPLSMLDTTAATELIAYLQKFAAGGKALVMFEHRHEYLDNLPELHHIALSGKERETDFPSANLSARENFKLNIDQLHVQLGKREVIQNLDLEINSGQIVAIVGRNGVGKTTLLRSLTDLQKHGGSIKIKTAHGDETPNFGIAFQNPDLQMFNASVRDEMLYRLPNPDLNYFRWLLSALGLERYENTPPLLLSEGEKKRVALGLVLMRQPAHGLLLDEPSLGQDQLHKTILIRLLRTLADAGQLVMMTTHDLTLASHADRLILLGPGCEVIADGLSDAVLNDSSVWQKSGILLPDWFLCGRAETQ